MTALRAAAEQHWQGLPSWVRSPAVHGALATAVAVVLLLAFGMVVQGVVHAGENARATQNGAVPKAVVHPVDATAAHSPGVDGV